MYITLYQLYIFGRMRRRGKDRNKELKIVQEKREQNILV